MQGNRLQMRTARIRAALVNAAQGFIAQGRVNVPVLEITQAAGVGMGSFYNHFESKEALFQAAVDDALESVGLYLDALTADTDDPVEVFTQSFRLAGRAFRLQPKLSRVLLNSAGSLMDSDKGLAPRSRRDIAAAADAGRFEVDDLDRVMALVAGTLFAMGRLLLEDADRDEETTVDRTAADVLRALGVSTDEARELSTRPLPHFHGEAMNSVFESVSGGAAKN